VGSLTRLLGNLISCLDETSNNFKKALDISSELFTETANRDPTVQKLLSNFRSKHESLTKKLENLRKMIPQ
jgi:ABC-type transporter Mla subunit MlaD